MEYIQIGVTALRSPTGEFLPAVPIYIKKEDAGQINESTGRTYLEELAIKDISKVFADKFRKYAEGGKRS